MAILKDDDRKQLTKIFEQLTNPVKLVLFTQDVECDYCQITHEMVDEVCSISPKLSLEVKDFVKDEAEAEKMGVDKIPAIAIIGDKDYGIRMFGVPSGYEFSTLVESIIDVSLRRHGLPANVLDELAKVDKPVRMQVLITPTWPYCPRAVRTAHQFAIASDYISGEMVEVSEYPHLAVKYEVQGVPHTVINDEEHVIGLVQPIEFAQAVLRSIGK